jgi:hypothetical protein
MKILKFISKLNLKKALVVCSLGLLPFVLADSYYSVAAVHQDQLEIFLSHRNYQGIASFLMASRENLSEIAEKINDLCDDDLDSISQIVAAVSRQNIVLAWELVHRLDHTGDDTIEILARMVSFAPDQAIRLLDRFLTNDWDSFNHDLPLSQEKIAEVIAYIYENNPGEAGELQKHLRSL